MELKVSQTFVECRGSVDEFRALKEAMKVANPKARFQSKRKRYSEEEEIDPYIYFVDDDGLFLRGLLPWAEECLERLEIEYKIILAVEEQPADFIPCPPNIVDPPLRDYQAMCVEQGIYRKRGIIHAATGSGKTNIIAAANKIIEQHYGGRTLTFVNKNRLMYQTANRFQELGLTSVGIIGAGAYQPAQHTVVMVQTAHKLLRKGITDWYENVLLVNWDETHHLGADTWSALACNIGAEWSLGYSGTPYRQGERNFSDPADIQLLGITGGVIASVSASYLIQRGLLARPYIYMIPVVHTSHDCGDKSKADRKKYGCNRPDDWNHVEKLGIVDNGHRNNLICRLTLKLAEYGLNPLILVSKIEHGHALLRELGIKYGLKGYFLSGGPKKHFYDPLVDLVVTEVDDDPEGSMKKFLSGEHQFLIGSTVFDEGIDLPAVTDVINCAGGRSFIKNMQRVGRGLRAKEGDNIARIWDFYDYTHEWLARHSEERIRDYSSEDQYVVYRNGYSDSIEFFNGEQW